MSASSQSRYPQDLTPATQSLNEVLTLSAVTFTPFSNLPHEIRCAIWEEVCSEPRIVDLWYYSSLHFQVEFDLKEIQSCAKLFVGSKDSVNDLQEFASHCSPPSVLHVCREARKIGLRFYSLEFGLDLMRSSDSIKVSFRLESKIYINWASDIILPIFRWPIKDDEDRLERFKKMKRVAIYIRADWYGRDDDIMSFTNYRLNSWFDEIYLCWSRSYKEDKRDDILLKIDFEPERRLKFDLLPLSQCTSDVDYLIAEKKLLQAKTNIDEALKKQKEDFPEWTPPSVKLMILNIKQLQIY